MAAFQPAIVREVVVGLSATGLAGPWRGDEGEDGLLIFEGPVPVPGPVLHFLAGLLGQ